MSCYEVEIHEKLCIQSNNYNYVFAALDTKDPSFWMFSCSCKYKSSENKCIPRYNLHDPIWISEYKCRKYYDTICKHIKTCYISKIIVIQTRYNINIPDWAKNFMGKDYYKNSVNTIHEISPIPWGRIDDKNRRHGIGRIKIYDFNEYDIKLINNGFGKKNWTCTCEIFNQWNTNCIHIYKTQLKENYLQNRRELCISLARKYINQIH